MKEYSFKNGKIKFMFSDKNGLCIEIKNGEKSFELKFQDGVFDKRITHDGAVYEKLSFYNTYHSDVQIEEDKNTLYIVSNPKNTENGKILDDICVTNVFTVEENGETITQKTFFKEAKTVYDRSFFVARMNVSGGDFKTVESEPIKARFDMEATQSCIAYPGELTLRGEECYLRLLGGTVSYEKGSADAHLHSLRYNDTLSYYNEENPIFTVYSFNEKNNCALPVHKAEESAENGKSTKIECGKLCFKLYCSENEAAFLSGGARKPFAAMLLKNIQDGEEIFADTMSDWKKVSLSREGDEIKLLLENPLSGKIKDICLEITGKLYPSENKAEWSSKVINNSEIYSVLWLTYPRFYANIGKESKLFVPAHGGTVESGFGETDCYTGGSYPSGFYYTMPYYALYGKDSGFYYAIHDKDGSFKELYAASSQNGEVRFSARFYAENYGKCKNTTVLPGTAVWQVFAGDWYDATNIYREFNDKNSYWCTEEKSTNTPEWMKEIPLWLMDWVPYDPESGEILPTRLRQDTDVVGENDWYENAIAISKALGTPIGYHIYNWHQIPFNNDYPHFMPARERFVEGLRKMKEYDIRVMPYINALLWDTRDKGDEDYMFSEFAKPGAVKKINGDIQTLTYESKEKDGSRVKLAPMCPTYNFWREFLTKLTGEMFEKLDIDAIYLDQISARVPHLCMDESHPHPVGGGSWWGKAYNELLGELNRNKPEGKAFTSESSAEVYSGSLDGFLSWAWIQTEKDVPAFMKLYSDKITVFGRNANGHMKNDDIHWKYHFAQALVSGQQPGWVNTDFVKNKNRLEFVKKLVRFRYENKEFFKFPTVMRPATVQADEENCFNSAIGMYHSGIIHSPYLCTGTLENNGRRMMIIVNIADRDISDNISFNKVEYGLKQGEYSILGLGKVNEFKDGMINVTVEKESYLAILW